MGGFGSEAFGRVPAPSFPPHPEPCPPTSRTATLAPAGHTSLRRMDATRSDPQCPTRFGVRVVAAKSRDKPGGKQEPFCGRGKKHLILERVPTFPLEFGPSTLRRGQQHRETSLPMHRRSQLFLPRSPERRPQRHRGSSLLFRRLWHSFSRSWRRVRLGSLRRPQERIFIPWLLVPMSMVSGPHHGRCFKQEPCGGTSTG